MCDSQQSKSARRFAPFSLSRPSGKSVLPNALLGVVLGLILYNQVSAAAIAIPNLLEARIGANESAAIQLHGFGTFVTRDKGAKFFDLQIAYDPGIVQPVSAMFGTALGDPGAGEAVTSFSIPTPGILDVSEESFLPNAVLNPMQPDTFDLVTIEFMPLALGTTSLVFVQADLFDTDFQPIPITVEHGMIVVLPEPGDGNGDGWIDGLDYLLWAGNYGRHPGSDGDISDGDYNDDGWIDGLDYLLWAANYGHHIRGVSVPEPTALTTALLATFGFLSIRRYRSGRRHAFGCVIN